MTRKKNMLARAGVMSALVVGLSIACIPGAIAYSTEQSAGAGVQPTGEAAAYQKTEVVYANLAASGAVEDVYIVNQFDVEEAGEIIDYGSYCQVANLTDQAALKHADGATTFEAPTGAFYYQGNPDSVRLPWDVSIEYAIDGNAMSAQDVAGKSGELSIHVTTSAAAGAEEAFLGSYMMQITFTLNGDTTTDIVAEGATVAQSGRDRTVAFTVLPGQDADFVLKAKVVDFEMSGATIAALPYSMVMDMPETDGMTEGIGQLSSAISQLDSGTAELADGVSALSSGASQLADGSDEFGAGLSELNANASSLVAGSAAINDALQQIAAALDGFDMSGLEGLDVPGQLPGYLRSVASDLDELYDLVNQVPSTYEGVYQSVDSAIKNLPTGSVDEGEFGDIRDAVAASGDEGAASTTEGLISTYEAAKRLKDAYGDGTTFAEANRILQILGGSGAMPQSINQAASLLRQVADLLESSEDASGMLSQIVQLVEGLKMLASQYGEFHSGLVQFADGLDQLTAGYAGINEGAAGLADGASQLDEGASQLSSGISQLNSVTINLPDTMRAEIEAMMADYAFPEFDPISFVDSRNDENMAAVQFVMTTDAIEVPEAEVAEEVEEEERTIIDRFFALFQ